MSGQSGWKYRCTLPADQHLMHQAHRTTPHALDDANCTLGCPQHCSSRTTTSSGQGPYLIAISTSKGGLHPTDCWHTCKNDFASVPVLEQSKYWPFTFLLHLLPERPRTGDTVPKPATCISWGLNQQADLVLLCMQSTTPDDMKPMAAAVSAR